jgi:hypothetical protein
MTQRLISCAFLLVIGTLTIGCAAKQFTATVTFLDGSTRDVTNETPGTVGPFWSSGSTSVATVSSTGMVTGVAQGSVVIQVKYHSFFNNVVIQIN